MHNFDEERYYAIKQLLVDPGLSARMSVAYIEDLINERDLLHEKLFGIDFYDDWANGYDEYRDN